MDDLFSHLTITDIHRDLFRNIVSLRESQDLFDDLSDSEAAWRLAQQVEYNTKPPPYQSTIPVIHRPFEDAKWFNAIDYPFRHWQANRFSDGSFGVWYGGGSMETTIHETAYHWYHGLLSDAGFTQETVIGERKLYLVACDAALLDCRMLVDDYPDLIHPTSYHATHRVGARIFREGHPGLLTQSVRDSHGDNYVIFNPQVLSNPRNYCLLTYRLQGKKIVIEKESGSDWMAIAME